MHMALDLIPFETGLTAKLCVIVLGRPQKCFHPYLRMRDETMILILFFSCLVFVWRFILSTAVVCILALGYTVLYRELERACCTGDLRSWIWSNRKRELECIYTYELLSLLGYLEHAGTIQACWKHLT